MKNLLLLSIAFLGASQVAPAQNSLLFALENDEYTLQAGGGLIEAGTVTSDEVAIVTPQAGPYSAAAFLGKGAQWAYIGDADLDGRLVDASTTGPGGDTDAVFVKHFIGAPTGPVGPRDIYVSKEGVDGFAPSVQDGDVFRYASQGAVEVFVSEAQLLTAIGQPGGDVELDAICQSPTGDLFVSFADSETVGGITADDGGIVMIPASAITYDLTTGNVMAVMASSAVVVASEADVTAMVIQSGMATSVGGVPSTSSSFDLTALELDPQGGTWTSQQTSSTLPNLLFGWFGFSNDGAVLSTNGGGSLASLNGQPLASAVATTGTQIGLAPDSTGLDGLAGIAVVAQQPGPLVLENFPTNLITSSTILWTRKEVSGATPNAPVAFLVDGGPMMTGGVLPVVTIPGIGGELFGVGAFVVLGTSNADVNGYAGFALNMPPSIVGSGANFVWQAYDLVSAQLSAPAGMQFL